MVGVDGHAGLLELGEHAHQRELDVAEQRRAAAVVELVVERLGEVEHRARLEHGGLAGRVVADAVEAELVAVVDGAGLELALEVAHGQVGQVVGALVGTGEVRRERGVALQPVEGPAARGERQHRALRVVEHLRHLRVGQPGSHGRVVLGAELGRVDPGRVAGAGRERQPGDLAGARAPGALHLDADPAVAGVLVEPRPDLTRPGSRSVEVEARPVDLLHGLEGLEQPVAQHPELQAVEQGVDLLPVPRLHRQVGRHQRQLEVGDQRVELPVADHVPEVLAQRLPCLARDLLGPVDDVVEPVVLGDPLGRGLRPDARDAGEVVGGLADECGELGVARRREAVALLDGGGRHALHLRDAAHRVDDGGAVVDQLEGVAVAAADQDLEVVGHRLGGEGADDVVGLEPVLLDERHPQRGEDLLDQGHLSLELRG